MRLTSLMEKCKKVKCFIVFSLFALYELIHLIIIKHEADLYVLMSRPIGDVVYGLAYVNSLKLKSCKNIVVFIEESKDRLVQQYTGVDKICFFKKNDKQWLRIQCLIGFRVLLKIARCFNIYGTVPWVFVHDNSILRMDALSIIRNEIFSLDENASIEYPCFADEPIVSIPNFENVKNKIIVLNPYSNSMISENLSVFELIAKILLDDGYIVYTNIVENQLPIKGTLALFCSIYEFYSICNQVQFVISIRSGIIDLCISANTQFIVIYYPKVSWKESYSQGFFYDYTLQAWKTNNVTELKYMNDNLTVASILKIIK